MTHPFDYYKNLYEESPLETATITEVNYTPVRVPIPGSLTSNEVLVPHYSCKLVTDSDQRVYDNIPWLSPYANPHTGGGLYIVPKPNTKVLVAFAKKGQPFIIGWLTPVAIDGRYTNNKEIMPGGSMAMRGDFGNKIVVQDGGIITVESTKVCKRTYTPVFDQIRDFCRNYFLTTSGGQLSWQESRDGQRLTSLRIEAFEKAQKGGKSVRVQYGSHTEDAGDPEPTTPAGKLFSFIVGEKTSVFIGPNGRIMIKNEHPSGGDNNDISIDNDGKLTINNLKEVAVNTEDGAIKFKAGSGGQTTIEMEPDGDVNIKSATKISIQAPEVEVIALVSAKVEAPQVEVTATVEAVVTAPTVTVQSAGTVQVTANVVNVQAQVGVSLQAPLVVTLGGVTALGGGGLGIARQFDTIIAFTGDGPVTGLILGGSFNNFAS